MIPVVAQALAHLLVAGTSLDSVEQISFHRPENPQTMTRGVNVYFYDLRATEKAGDNAENPPPLTEKDSPQMTTTQTVGQEGVLWFDVSFLVSTYDYTALGAQQLLSESLTLFLRYAQIPHPFLDASIPGFRALPLRVNLETDWVELWKALDLPLRPALCVTVTMPASQISVPVLLDNSLEFMLPHP
ncbi:Pvc16 family protein [Spirulina subsalsa]|uniref:Pvc16 family protein n=1 Tax=Spirulina subsalsa TaxID=54311 RepID=UPI0002DA892B|nr:Pvc16 family protein [Spirulina subsalsa]